MGMKPMDITDERYGKLIAIKPTEKRQSGAVVWVCQCDCGNIIETTTSRLRNGTTQSCGCLREERLRKAVAIDETGNQYGRLTVVEPTTKKSNDRCIIWKCICECGNKTEVSSRSLRDGNTRSCGCLQRDTTSVMMSGENHYNYNHDLTLEERENGRLALGKDRLNKWRLSVYERDDYTCQVCDKRGGDINAHHLDGWHWCKEKRFDVENGVTLCSSCHRQFHKEYGRNKNTKEEFDQFKNKEIGQLALF